jgi:hypothetical protein
VLGLLLTGGLAGVLPAQVAPPTVIPPKTVTLPTKNPTLTDILKALPAQTGLAVDAAGLDLAAQGPGGLNQVPFWTALEQVAAKAGARITLGNHGRRISLVKRSGPPPPSSVSGPFRVVVRQVRPTLDLETGLTFTELTLDLHWEPRFPVFRIDSQPTLTAIEDDRNSKLTALTARSRTPPTGAQFTTSIRIHGVPRSATKLNRVSGSFTVTASPRMLAFTFPDLAGSFPMPGTLPAGETENRVRVVLRRFEKVGDLWEAEFELTYPPAGPEFESFESWITENRARLVTPDRSRTLNPVDEDVPETGRRTVAIYRFKGVDPGNRAGWSLVYETPAPLVEFPVRFDLKEIPLP